MLDTDTQGSEANSSAAGTKASATVMNDMATTAGIPNSKWDALSKMFGASTGHPSSMLYQMWTDPGSIPRDETLRKQFLKYTKDEGSDAASGIVSYFEKDCEDTGVTLQVGLANFEEAFALLSDTHLNFSEMLNRAHSKQTGEGGGNKVNQGFWWTDHSSNYDSDDDEKSKAETDSGPTHDENGV